VVAPETTAGGQPLIRLTDRYAAAVYPLIDGESFGWGKFADETHRDAVRDMLVEVHAAPAAVRRRAARRTTSTCPTATPWRRRSTARTCRVWARMPGARPDLIARHAPEIRGLLSRYDELAAGADRRRSVAHPRRTAPREHGAHRGGWRLIDWDTALVAPPERDLWLLGGGFAAYTEETGIDVLPEMLEMYRLRWYIADLAVGRRRFRRPHPGDCQRRRGVDHPPDRRRGISLWTPATRPVRRGAKEIAPPHDFSTERCAAGCGEQPDGNAVQLVQRRS
jgi:spectinomycin phosphotransferase/16S rRNA (guanine(1405)-N(7))-methyltransferase